MTREDISHKALQKFLDEVIEELEEINKYRKSRNKKEYIISNLIKSLHQSLSREVQMYAEFITDLEKCDTSAPVITEYGNDDNCGTVIILLKMLKTYDEFGNCYCPLKHRYELIFYKDLYTNQEDGEEKQYRFMLRKVFSIASGSC